MSTQENNASQPSAKLAQALKKKRKRIITEDTPNTPQQQQQQKKKAVVAKKRIAHPAPKASPSDAKPSKDAPQQKQKVQIQRTPAHDAIALTHLGQFANEKHRRDVYASGSVKPIPEATRIRLTDQARDALVTNVVFPTVAHIVAAAEEHAVAMGSDIITNADVVIGLSESTEMKPRPFGMHMMPAPVILK